MIAYIQGTLVGCDGEVAVLDNQGVGYEVCVPATTAEKLPPPGTLLRLHTHAVYREDAQTLYGFTSIAERNFFRLLIANVTGVGPKMALGIMGRLSLPVLENAIRIGDIALLAKSPGIGKKTAERLVVELKNKLGGVGLEGAIAPGESNAGSGTASQAGTRDNRQTDAVGALVALGYKAADADQAVRRALLALGADATAESLIKKALAG